MGEIEQGDDDYLLYEAFSSDEFVIFTHVYIGILCVIIPCAMIMHLSSVYQDRKKTRNGVYRVSKIVRDHHINSAQYFIFHTIFILNCAWLTAIDADENEQNCDAFWITGETIYFISNFTLYRLLLSKASLYDPMSQMKIVTKIAWFLIHIIYFPIIFLAFILLFVQKSHFEMFRGDKRCVRETNTGVVQGLLALDSAISILCVTTLVSPLYFGKGNTPGRVYRNVLRNVCMSFFAVFTTGFTLGYSAAAQSKNNIFIVEIIARVLLLDVGINMTCLTLSWPPHFYWIQFTRLIGRAEPGTPRGGRSSNFRSSDQTRSVTSRPKPGTGGIATSQYLTSKKKKSMLSSKNALIAPQSLNSMKVNKGGGERKLEAIDEKEPKTLSSIGTPHNEQTDATVKARVQLMASDDELQESAAGTKM